MPRLTPEQLAMRASGIGSSDLPAILGISPYQGDNQWRVYCDKLNLLEREPETIEQRLGHELEDIAGKLYEEQFGETLPGGTIIHPEYPWAFATIDRKAMGVSRGLECKAVGTWMQHHWRPVPTGVPQYARVQANWQMWCASYQEIDVSAILGGTDWKVWRIERDNDLIAQLHETAWQFWQRVQRQEPPPWDGSEACRLWLEAKYPREKSAVILDATPESEEIAQRRITAAMLESDSEDEKDDCDHQLMAIVGDAASGIQGEGWRLTWRTDASGRRVKRFTVRRSKKGSTDGD